MVSERIRKIRDISFDYGEMSKYISVQEIRFTPDPQKSRILRHADAFCAVMDQLETNYIPGSLLAGNGGDKFAARPRHLFAEEMEEIRQYPRGCRKELLDALREEMFFIWPFSDGHIAPHFERLLQTGIDGLLAEIGKRMKDTGLSPKQAAFLAAAKQEWEAVKRLALRYAGFFRKKAAQAARQEERDAYLETADTVTRVPAGPARTFREALQSVYFLHMCTQFDDVSNHSFGRFDQYMYPYYERDIEKGILTKEQARDLFYEFWLKFTPGYLKSQHDGQRSEGQGFLKENIPENGLTWLTLKCISHVRHLDDGQTMDICGYTKGGGDATNDISRMAIEALDLFRTFEPKPVVQYTEKTDQALMDRCYAILASGHGHPAIAYPKNGREGLRRYDGYFREEDIGNYCHIGCVEPGIAGKGYTDPMNCFFNLPKALLVTIQGGYLDGKQIGLLQETPRTYEAFLRNFYEQVGYFMDLYVEGSNDANPFYAQYFFRPLVSAAIDGCIKKALAVDEGGSEYWSKGMNIAGLATAADSLYAIKKLVYDEREMGIGELAGILQGNYEKQDALRSRLANRLPKYGNGQGEVDRIAAGLARYCCERVRSYRTYNGNRYRPGLYSFYETVNRLGSVTGATPNGRKAGERFSLNTAPDHGAIRSGITPALRSVTAFAHSLADNACTVDLHLCAGTPPGAIRSVSEYLNGHGALYLQTSVVDKEDMERAEIHPEDYRDLVVRVTGFSALYVTLDEATRNEIRERSYWG
ncbi:pyruvate formate lyase family protein [Christensenella timonensis]|uniref:pyruvate formate lyase family protein n=1 Tax=Christensenella timonensis TaxID=1816678 RepID=UPI00083607B5|nr:pyruvate formate lyase family protein [Christensenella timonensis]